MPKNMFDEFVYHLPDECTLMNEITRIAEAAEITSTYPFILPRICHAINNS